MSECEAGLLADRVLGGDDEESDEVLGGLGGLEVMFLLRRLRGVVGCFRNWVDLSRRRITV